MRFKKKSCFFFKIWVLWSLIIPYSKIEKQIWYFILAIICLVSYSGKFSAMLLWKLDKIQIELACLTVYGKFSSHFSILLPGVPFRFVWSSKIFEKKTVEYFWHYFRCLLKPNFQVTIYLFTPGNRVDRKCINFLSNK